MMGASRSVAIEDQRSFPVFNPAFVARVQKKRREQARIAAAQEAERKERERQERWNQIVHDRLSKAAEAEKRMEADNVITLPDAPISVRSIIAQVEREHGLSEGSIVSPTRKTAVIKARFEAIARAREARPDLSLPQLGRIFGRDHTTVLHALRKMGLQTKRAPA